MLPHNGVSGASLPVYSDRIAQEFHLISSSPDAGVTGAPEH